MQFTRKEALMLNRTIVALLASGTVLTVPAFAAQRWGYGPVPHAGACFYEQTNYRGRYFCARTGEDIAVIPNDFNGRIRSIRVFGGGQVVLYSNDRYGGSERWIDYSVPALRSEGWLHGRSAMQRYKALAIVRAAFMNVLGREPDPASAGWVDRVFNDHWSQQQLENE